MKDNPILRPWTLFISFTGLVQSVLWIGLSIVAILTYKDILDFVNPHFPITSLGHYDSLITAFRGLYFSNLETKLYIRDEELFTFACIYLVISFIWMISSSVLFYYARFSKWPALQVTLYYHAAIVASVCVVDIVFMSFLIADYVEVLDDTPVSSTTGRGITSLETYVLLALGIMFTLAARGYVLLLLNIASVVYSLVVLFAHRCKGEPVHRTIYDMPIDAYREYPRHDDVIEAFNQEPFAWKPQTNHGFVPDPDDYQRNHPDFEQFRFHPGRSAVQNNSRPVSPVPEPPRIPQMPPAPIWLGGSHATDPLHLRREESFRRYQEPQQLPNTIPKPPPPMPPPKPLKRVVKPAKPQGKKGPPIPYPDYTPPASPKDPRSVIKPVSSYY